MAFTMNLHQERGIVYKTIKRVFIPHGTVRTLTHHLITSLLHIISLRWRRVEGLCSLIPHVLSKLLTTTVLLCNELLKRCETVGTLYLATVTLALASR